MAYQAEYIWIDGVEPTPLLRSKTKIIADGDEPGDLGLRRIAAPSRLPATTATACCKPVFSCPDPLRGGDNVLVLCEVLMLVDMKPHPTNTRAACEKVAKKYAKQELMFGIEQEYTMLKANGRPLGFPDGRLPRPAGPVLLRRRHRPHHRARDRRGAHAGLHRRRARASSGTNAEVMPGQWEFQIGAAGAARPSATTCTSPAGCCTASPRTST